MLHCGCVWNSVKLIFWVPVHIMKRLCLLGVFVVPVFLKFAFQLSECQPYVLETPDLWNRRVPLEKVFKHMSPKKYQGDICQNRDCKILNFVREFPSQNYSFTRSIITKPLYFRCFFGNLFFLLDMFRTFEWDFWNVKISKSRRRPVLRSFLTCLWWCFSLAFEKWCRGIGYY